MNRSIDHGTTWDDMRHGQAKMTRSHVLYSSGLHGMEGVFVLLNAESCCLIAMRMDLRRFFREDGASSKKGTIELL